MHACVCLQNNVINTPLKYSGVDGESIELKFRLRGSFRHPAASWHSDCCNIHSVSLSLFILSGYLTVEASVLCLHLCMQLFCKTYFFLSMGLKKVSSKNSAVRKRQMMCTDLKKEMK